MSVPGGALAFGTDYLLRRKTAAVKNVTQRITSTLVKGFAMTRLVMGSVVLLMLAACGGYGRGHTGSDGNAQTVCNQQSDWARSGKIGGGDITITCPGYARPGY
jgi:hypothetical protein